MARARDPNRDVAKKMYLDSNGEMLLKDIAEAVGKSDTQIRKWKNHDKWDDELKGNVTNRTKSNVTNQKKRKNARVHNMAPEVEMVTDAFVEETEENASLSDVQRFFCLYFIKYLNATKAYQKAYDSTYEVANKNAYVLMVNHGIRTEITRLKRARAAGIMLDKNDVLQKYIDIAFADMGDYVEYGTEEVPLLDEDGLQLVDENGDPRTYQRSYVRFKDSAALDNTIISEVKQGKDGVSVKLHDKMKALEVLAKYTDLLDEHTKTNLQNEKVKVELINAELKKTQDQQAHDLRIEQARLNVEKSKIDIELKNKELEILGDNNKDKTLNINLVRKG